MAAAKKDGLGVEGNDGIGYRLTNESGPLTGRHKTAADAQKAYDSAQASAKAARDAAKKAAAEAEADEGDE